MDKLLNLIALTKEWGERKGITGPAGKGTLRGQARKFIEEAAETFGEVHELASIKDNFSSEDVPLVARPTFERALDGVGDTLVTLILLCEFLGTDLEECLQKAYDEINGRTGNMVNGVFVKDK